MGMRIARTCALVALVLVLAVAGNEALAKKPVKPPPPTPDPGDVGTIYFGLLGDLYEMAGDGSAKTPLPLDQSDWQYGFGVPSEARHGSERWFLRFKSIEGETYPSTWPHCELYAVSESGVEVRLSSDPDLEPVEPARMPPQWATESGIVDGKVSMVCRHWVWDPVAEEWAVDAWGLYVAYLDPADLADGLDLDLTWTRLPIDLPRNYPDFQGGLFACPHDWTPDGTRIVYDDSGFDAPGNIYVAAPASPTWTRTLVGWGTVPRWSPDAGRILFNAPDGIHTMAPSGADVQLIVPDPPDKPNTRKSLYQPFWSPSGTHVVYLYHEKPDNEFRPDTRDIYRVRADGTGAVNLTEDTDLWVNGIYGWLED